MPAMKDGVLELLLRDVARRIQLPPSKHEVAERQFRAITDHVDREGSPLEGLVIQAYPSGSFAIHAAIASRVRSEQYDVDIVLELNIPENTDPEVVLRTTFDAINGEPGTRYHGKVELNSRCVTVLYEDGVSIDVMPVARLPEPLEKASSLFHFKEETGEKAHKLVNPYGFAVLYNEAVNNGVRTVEVYRRRLAGGLIVEAETQPLPAAVPFEEKPTRTLALQLLKRNRTILYRERKDMRCPPSVVLARLALGAGATSGSLVDELLAVTQAVHAAIHAAESQGVVLSVDNPAYPNKDYFTDRWPENRAAQRLYRNDLARLHQAISRLSISDFDAGEVGDALKALFGEAASEYALNEHFSRQQKDREAGRLGVAAKGRIGIVGAAAATGTVSSVRASTNMGGLLEDD